MTGKAFIYLSKKVPRDIRVWTRSPMLSDAFSPFNLSNAGCVCELLSIISNVRIPQFFFCYRHRHRRHRCRCRRCRHSHHYHVFFFIFFRYSRARGTGFREIFFFHPRFLDGDLMELKSFRDAHRCALYSHATRGTRRKNSLRAKKESPDRWSTIWEINYRARRNLTEIISHGSAIVIAVVALKSLLRALAARVESPLIDTLILSLTKIVHHAHDIITDWCCFFYIVLFFYNKKRRELLLMIIVS